MASERFRLGECLINKKLITQEQFEQANVESKKNKSRIGEEIIRLGFVTEEDVYQTLSEQLDIAFIDVLSCEIDPQCVNLISWSDIKRLQSLPVFKVGNVLTVAMVDPLNVEIIDEIEQKTKLGLNPVFTTPHSINQIIAKYSDKEKEQFADDIDSAVSGSKIDNAAVSKSEEIPKLIEEATQGPVIQLVQEILVKAISKRASDIHLEPQEKGFYCRYRVDGKLQEPVQLKQELQSATISRIKIMADIDISEQRLPQDGRAKISIKNKDIDLRVATFPTIYGEHVAIRILDKSTGVLKLDELGLKGPLLTEFKKVICRPHGIILVTGPTGTGKTTTLYSVLNTINETKNNIITLEDPVEYSIDGIHQSQVNVKAGLTFAVGLRSIVRIDPDIIMIGEIRDKETAEISIHAALTGHLVFSTLHTNNAPSACARLIDIGVEPYLLASSLTAVLAQRLVRKLCSKCKEPYEPSESELLKIGLSENEDCSKMTFYKEKGCKECQDVGFKGRIGVFELFIPNDKIKEMISRKASAAEISEEAKRSGMKTLLQDSIDKVTSGMTSLPEIINAIEVV